MSQAPTGFDPNADDLFYEQPVWPKVVGIISIVFATLGFGCIGCGALSMGVFIPMAEEALGEPLPPPMQPGVLQWGLMGVGVLTSLMLIGAGILTLTRKPSGRTLHLAWALISALLSILNLFIQFAQQSRIQEWIENNPDSQWAQQQAGQGQLSQTIGLVVGLFVGLGYPVFCLVWFGLIKTKPNQMTGEPDAVDPFANPE